MPPRVPKKPTKRLFWKIWAAHRGWADRSFQLHWVEDEIFGIDCVGVTMFDQWGTN